MKNFASQIQTAFPLGKLSRNARLFLLAAVIEGIIYSTWSLYINFFVFPRGFDRQFMGLANAMPWMASLLLGLLMGIFSDHIGRRKAMLLGLISLSLGSLLEVTVRIPVVMLASGFLAGAGGALYFNSQAPLMMSASTTEPRPLLFSLSSGIITQSGAVGSFVAGRLPQLLSSWIGQAADGTGVLQIIMIVAVGPYISGIVQVRSGFTPLFITTTLLYLAATGFRWFFFGNAEKKTDMVLASMEVNFED